MYRSACQFTIVLLSEKYLDQFNWYCKTELKYLVFYFDKYLPNCSHISRTMGHDFDFQNGDTLDFSGSNYAVFNLLFTANVR